MPTTLALATVRCQKSGSSDRLYGGYGNDTLNGGDGNDELYGEMDDDKLCGGNVGDDRLNGRGWC